MSNTDPAEILGSDARDDSEPYGRDSGDLPPASVRKGEREGLPPGYRMRADAHYVEQLASRRSERSPSDEGRSDLRDRRDRRTDQVLVQLAEDLQTIASAATLVAGDASAIARRVNLDLIRSQAWRAAWLLRASAIVGGTYESQRRPRSLGFIFNQVRTGFEPEARLAGFTLNVTAADWAAVVAVDEAAVIAGVTGGVIALLGVIGQAEGVGIAVKATLAGQHLQAIEITQHDVAVTGSASVRFFDSGWSGRPGGWMGDLGAQTARAVVEQHGGHASFHAGERSGCTLRMDFTRDRSLRD